LSAVLSDVTIEQLRNSDSKRVLVKDEIDDILSKFGV
jgi:hypothetical protein